MYPDLLVSTVYQPGLIPLNEYVPELFVVSVLAIVPVVTFNPLLALRETPLDSITLENALKLSKSGAIIAPVSPGLYLEESSISDLADTFSDKLLSLVGLHKDNGWRNEEI